MTHQDQAQSPPHWSPSSAKAHKRLETWERKFREAKTPAGRHWAMSQLWRHTTDDHPIVQLWLNRNRDPRFNDMTWTFPEGSHASRPMT